MAACAWEAAANSCPRFVGVVIVALSAMFGALTMLDGTKHPQTVLFVGDGPRSICRLVSVHPRVRELSARRTSITKMTTRSAMVAGAFLISAVAAQAAGLVTAKKRMTLYVFDKDAGGESAGCREGPAGLHCSA